jgi:polyisoprenoid-binding protein YceI
VWRWHWLGRLLGACALLASAGAAAADSGTDILQFDRQQSHAEFSVRVMWLIPVHGRFASVHGTIAIDRFRSSARVEALIDVADVHMRSRGDEAWVKSAEFFDAQHFPQIQFVSDPFSLSRLDKGGEVAGMLTIRGVARPARFDLEPSECKGASGRECPVEAEGTIRRSEFGMRSRRGALSDKVDLSFSIRVLAPPKPTP